MQLCFETEEKAKRLLHNVSSLLKPGGYFLGICPDSSTIWYSVIWSCCFPHLFLTLGLFLTSYLAISIWKLRSCLCNQLFLNLAHFYLVYLILLVLNSITRWSVEYWHWNLNLVWSIGDLFGIQEQVLVKLKICRKTSLWFMVDRHAQPPELTILYDIYNASILCRLCFMIYTLQAMSNDFLKIVIVIFKEL